MNHIVLATKNMNKVNELEQILAHSSIQVLSLRDFPNMPDVVEDGDSLEYNAMKKAREVSQFCKLPTLADDTGLFVDILDGEPGVFSARYAGENASYSDNVNKLLLECSKKGKFPFKARFKTCIAYYQNESEEHIFWGVCEGEIIEKPLGSKGFGYDPVFVPTGFNKTFAELDSSIKNEISHRARAVRKFNEFISSNFK